VGTNDVLCAEVLEEALFGPWAELDAVCPDGREQAERRREDEGQKEPQRRAEPGKHSRGRGLQERGVESEIRGRERVIERER
jgi:hypothetical protein